MKTILIVDDDEDFHEALEAAVASQGYTVDHAGNGREALGRLAPGGGRRPDAILVDLMMPLMDGWQLLDALRKDPELAAIPCAVLTAAPSAGALPPGVALLPKPCELRELLAFLRTACA